jgi:hypothetical protein
MSQKSSLETIVAHQLSTLLDKSATGLAIDLTPYPELFDSLERFIPHLLSLRYPEWEWESLDGLYTVMAQRLDSETAEFAGMCILISDQTITPFFIRLTLTTLHDSIASYRVSLGESGSGRLGISGPPCNTHGASKILANIGARLDKIRWVYRVESEIEQ